MPKIDHNDDNTGWSSGDNSNYFKRFWNFVCSQLKLKFIALHVTEPREKLRYLQEML